MSAVATAAVLAFFAAALLILVICINVTDYAPSDWTESGRAKAWIWCSLSGAIFSSIIYAALTGGAQ